MMAWLGLIVRVLSAIGVAIILALAVGLFNAINNPGQASGHALMVIMLIGMCWMGVNAIVALGIAIKTVRDL